MKKQWRGFIAAYGPSLIFWPLMLLAVVLLYKGQMPASFIGSDVSTTPTDFDMGFDVDDIGAADANATDASATDASATDASVADASVADASVADASVAAFVPQNAVRPVTGELLRTQGWNRHPIYNDWRLLPGVELAAAPGETVHLAYTGVVASVNKTEQESGWLVRVDHGSGWQSEYVGLETVFVQPAQQLSAGSSIGKVASISDASITFVLRSNGELVDPTHYLPH
jgi:murein DD-endopeptidase MepM/ murein hydrolase activator NlpD